MSTNFTFGPFQSLNHWPGISSIYLDPFIQKQIQDLVFIHYCSIPVSFKPDRRNPKEKLKLFSCSVRAVIKSIPAWQYFKLIRRHRRGNEKCKKSRPRLTFTKQ